MNRLKPLFLSFRQNACMVSTQGKQRYMGDEAAAIMKSNFKNTPVNIKRLIGRKFSEPEVRDLLVGFMLQIGCHSALTRCFSGIHTR